jgi:hypothetical protein
VTRYSTISFQMLTDVNHHVSTKKCFVTKIIKFGWGAKIDLELFLPAILFKTCENTDRPAYEESLQPLTAPIDWLRQDEGN